MRLSYPPAPNAQARETTVRFRMTQDERDELFALARERGRSISEICRVAVLREQHRKEPTAGQ